MFAEEGPLSEVLMQLFIQVVRRFTDYTAGVKYVLFK